MFFSVATFSGYTPIVNILSTFIPHFPTRFRQHLKILSPPRHVAPLRTRSPFVVSRHSVVTLRFFLNIYYLGVIVAKRLMLLLPWSWSLTWSSSWSKSSEVLQKRIDLWLILCWLKKLEFRSTGERTSSSVSACTEDRGRREWPRRKRSSNLFVSTRNTRDIWRRWSLWPCRGPEGMW